MQTLAEKCIPERERHIPCQSAALERQITELEECFGDLQGMLHSVRSEENKHLPESEVEQTKEVSLSCPVAEHLRQQTNRIRNICARIAHQLLVLET